MSCPISRAKSREEEGKSSPFGFAQECQPGYRKKSWSRSPISSPRQYKSRATPTTLPSPPISFALIALSTCSSLNRKKRRKETMKKNCSLSTWDRWPIWPPGQTQRNPASLSKAFLPTNRPYHLSFTFSFFCRLLKIWWSKLTLKSIAKYSAISSWKILMNSHKTNKIPIRICNKARD